MLPSSGFQRSQLGSSRSPSTAHPTEVAPVEWSRMTRTLAHYQRLEQIGEGTYGKVYRARSLDTGRIVALKKIRVHHGGYWGMPPTVLREIKILKRLRHPRLVEMVEVVSSKGVEYLEENDTALEERQNKRNSKKDRIVDAREGYKGNIYLVLEYVSHDLTGLMDVAFRFTEVQVKSIFRQLLEALEYMHAQKYVHRDIKSSNILIDSHFRVKLADFGLARCIEPPILDTFSNRGSHLELTNKVITLWYRPPEILLGATRYSFPVDVWSAGCILAELLLGKPLFTGKTEMDQLQLIFDMLGTPTNESWEGLNDLKLLRTGEVTIDKYRPPRLRDKYGNKISGPAFVLLEKLLELDPKKRLTANRALTSRYFLTEPRAPENPEELGILKLGEGGGHFHEFQTKKKRREAKATAKKASDDALARGMSEKEAEAEYDSVYRNCMKRVAEQGNAALLAEEPKQEEEFTPSARQEEVHQEVSRERTVRREGRDRESLKKEKEGGRGHVRDRRRSYDRHEKPEPALSLERRDRPDRKRHREDDGDGDRQRRRRKENAKEDRKEETPEHDSSRDRRRDVDKTEIDEKPAGDYSFTEPSERREEEREADDDGDDMNGSAKPADHKTERGRKRSDKEDRKRHRDRHGSSRDRGTSRERRHRSSRRSRGDSPRREDRRRREDKDRERHRRSSRDSRHRKGGHDRHGRSRNRSTSPDERDERRRGDWNGQGRDPDGGERGDWDRRMDPVGRGPDDWQQGPRDFRGDYYMGQHPVARRGPPPDHGPRRMEWSGPPPPGRFGPPESFGPPGRGPPPPAYRDERDRRNIPDFHGREHERNRPRR